MSDALEQAKRELDISTSALDASGSSRSYAEMTRAAESAQAAALIAIAEEVRTLNATLHDATDLNGAIKLTGDDHLEEIRNHLDDIGSVLLNARGPDGAIKVTQ